MCCSLARFCFLENHAVTRYIQTDDQGIETVTYQHSTAMLELSDTRVLFHAVPSRGQRYK